VTVLAPLGTGELLTQDLTTIELDLAAMEAGYARPPLPGFYLEVKIEPLRSGKGWRPWRR
jgi:hypothetical protein